jgi:hypothetical protein
MEIWKFPLQMQDVQKIDMPQIEKILCVQVQNNQPCLWALCYPGTAKQKRKITIYGTGHYMSEGYRDHIGTFQISGGQLVFHVFDEGMV